MRSRIPIKNDRLQKRRKKLFIVGLISIFVSLISIIVCTYFISRIDRFIISKVEIEDVVYQSSKSLNLEVEKALSGNYLFGLIPKKNIFLYPKHQIESALLFPSIIKVYTSVKDGLLSVSFDTRKPLITWCLEEVCTYIDNTGFSFASAPLIDGNAFISLKTDTLPQVGVSPITESVLSKAIYTYEGIKTEGLSIKTFSTKGDSLFFYDSSGMIIKISLKNDLKESISNIKTVLSSPEIKNKKLSEIDYIDIRFGSKVFFKVRGGVVGENKFR